MTRTEQQQKKARRQHTCSEYVRWLTAACEFAGEAVPEWASSSDLQALLHRAGEAHAQGLMNCHSWAPDCERHHCPCITCTLVVAAVRSFKSVVPYSMTWTSSINTCGHFSRAVKAMMLRAYSPQVQLVLNRLHTSMGSMHTRLGVMAFVTPMGEDVLSEDVCRGFIVKYMCESVMKIPEEAIYKKRSTREGGASAWKPPPRDVYLWTNPLWFGKGSRCRGPHVTGAGPVNGSRYCSCALIEVMVNDETSPSGRVIIAHRFAGNSPLGDAISQMFQSEVWQPYKHLKVYFKGCSTEVLNLPDVWSQRVICWGFAALQMIGATSDEMTTREWPAFRGELSNAGGDGKTFSISGVMGDHMSDVNRFDYTQAAEKLQEVTTDYGEKIFDVTQQVTLRFGHCASQIGPYTTEVDESIPLADTMLWDLRMRCLYLHRWLPPFKVSLIVTFADAFLRSIVCHDCRRMNAHTFLSSGRFRRPSRDGTDIMCIHGDDDPELIRRLECVRLSLANMRMEIELGDDFELVHDFRELRNALRWHYARVLTNLYGHENAPPDLSGTWPLLRPEHIVTTKREVRIVLREWLCLKPGLHCGYYLRKRTSEIYRHAFSWEHKRQLSMGDSMQRCNDGSVMPHLYVPGMLSELATVHSFIPCVRQTATGAVVWNKVAFST